MDEFIGCGEEGNRCSCKSEDECGYKYMAEELQNLIESGEIPKPHNPRTKMKQNTPMQKLIEFIETMPATNTPATEIRAKATELLQEEREVIEKAYDEDLYGGLSGKKKYDNGSDYYTQTYGGNNG